MSRKRARAEALQDVEPAPERALAVPTAGALEDEIGSLARALARGHRDLVDQFQRYAGLGADEAAEAASSPRDRALDLAGTEPPERMNWTTLAQAAQHEPTDALAAWERIKVAARQEWQSGHRTAQSLERGGTPWERARFLALRDAFRDDWRPRGGVEAALVDLLAQHFGSYLQWSERLALHVDTQCATEDATLERDGYWMPPRLSEAQMDAVVRRAGRGGPSPLPDDAQGAAGSAPPARGQHRRLWGRSTSRSSKSTFPRTRTTPATTGERFSEIMWGPRWAGSGQRAGGGGRRGRRPTGCWRSTCGCSLGGGTFAAGPGEGATGIETWRYDGKEVGRVGVRYHGDDPQAVTLEYRVCWPGEDVANHPRAGRAGSNALHIWWGTAMVRLCWLWEATRGALLRWWAVSVPPLP